MFQILGGEPWCWPPDVIARVTDWQAWHLYIRPAVKRAERVGRDGRGNGATGFDDEPRPRGQRVRGETNRLPSREEYVMVGVAFGGTPEAMGAEYDRVMGARGDDGGKGT